MGIEALSRGALQAVFVERSSAAIRTIWENLAHTKLEDGADVVRADVFDFLGRGPEPFDFIYVAPPQYEGLWARTLQVLEAHTGWLAPGCWVVAQIHPREYTDLSLHHLVLFDRRSYGSVMLCFYEAV